jgi:alkylated DNA repair dioxygenase AlkB
MQRTLLEPDLPAGFVYRPQFVTEGEEQDLLRRISTVEFSSVVMRGAIARRRTAHYGYTYGYEARTTAPGVPIPDFLLSVRERIAAWLGIEPAALAEALVTEYTPGAPIGWHRDAPMFGDVAGISLGSGCRMKFRPYVSPGALVSARRPRGTTHEIVLAPRSAYLITGVARKDFEHSIPPVERTRYSITFRTVVRGRAPRTTR